MRARRRPLPDHDVQLVVFECRVKDFFERRLQAVYLIDEQNLLVAQVGQDGGEVALDLQGRPGSLLEGDGQFVGDDGGERSLAQPGRTVEQNMVQSLAAGFGRFNRDRQVFFDLGLTDEFREALRPQLQLK